MLDPAPAAACRRPKDAFDRVAVERPARASDRSSSAAAAGVSAARWGRSSVID